MTRIGWFEDTVFLKLLSLSWRTAGESRTHSSFEGGGVTFMAFSGSDMNCTKSFSCKNINIEQLVAYLVTVTF